MHIKAKKLSIKERLRLWKLVVLIPLAVLVIVLLYELNTYCNAYDQLIKNVVIANEYYHSFKENIDQSIYRSVIKVVTFDELGTDGQTVEPYGYIKQVEESMDELERLSTSVKGRETIDNTKRNLDTLKSRLKDLEPNIGVTGSYDTNIEYLVNNIYILTDLFQENIQDYIYYESINFETIRIRLERNSYYLSAVCAGAVILLLLLTNFLSFIIAKGVTDPIDNLCKMTKKVAKGDFTVQTDMEMADEMAVLTDGFNSMTREIGRLVDDIKVEQRNLHIAETRLLQAQINPHFLYNTLDTIVWEAEQGKTDDVVTMVSLLSRFFRATLSGGRDFVTVSEEETQIESYLQIQKIRFQEIMNYSIDIDEGIKTMVIPKLMLQPVVENALNHGLRNKRGGGTIQITGRLQNENLIFCVTDDGRGMTEEELKKLKERIRNGKSNEDNSSYGLINISERIKNYYGIEDGLSFESSLHEGTVVTLKLGIKEFEGF